MKQTFTQSIGITWRKCHDPLITRVNTAMITKFVLPELKKTKTIPMNSHLKNCYMGLLPKIWTFPSSNQSLKQAKFMDEVPAKSVTLSNLRKAVIIKKNNWYPNCTNKTQSKSKINFGGREGEGENRNIQLQWQLELRNGNLKQLPFWFLFA